MSQKCPTMKKSQILEVSHSIPLTEVGDVVAGGVERAGVELEPHDGEDDDGEEQEQRDVHQRTDRLQDRRNHNLQA